MSTQVNQWQSSAGPRQTKAVNEALKALQWRGKSYTEISDYGEHSYTQPVSSPSDACKAEMNRIGEQFNWQVTRENYREVVAAFEAATKALVLPVIDKRSTPEERAEREAIHAENARRDAERNASIEASKSKLLPKVPAWADALIVAQLDEDDSDIMTDYHSHKTVRHVLIGFRKGKREDFRQLRAAAATFPETAHMGPGLDDWTVLIYAEPDQGPHSFRRREVWRDDSYDVRHFGTEAEAKAAIEAAMVVARQKAEAALAESGSHAIEPEECLYGYELACESVEHRENWSMGGGNYLKGGYRHSSGWKVRSVDRSHLNQYAIEDGLPVAAPAAEKPAHAAPVAGNGYQIEQHMHTKHGFEMSLVVLTGRVDRDRFETLRDSCKAAGGWYSRQWGKTPGGFAFKSREVAENWAAATLGGKVSAENYSEASAPVAAPSAPSVPITQGIAERLRKLAEGMTDKIEHARRPMTQNLTPKRQREYQSRLIDGNQMERTQKALLALADAWDAGTVPASLQHLRTKSDIYPLVRVRIESNSYYDVHETGQYADETIVAVALRALVTASESPEAESAAAELKRKQEIERMEHALVGLDIPGFFPTPRPVIERMLDEADIRPGQMVLEPSAGKGDIADAIRERHGDTEIALTVVEISPRLAAILREKGHDLSPVDDFLECRGTYDRIIMNPPFENGQDIDHVRHAYKLLAPGGRVVAIVSNGPFYRSDRKSVEFREWLDGQEVSMEELPAGTFNGKDSFRQTGVASKLVVIEKAAATAGSSNGYDDSADDQVSAGMKV